MLVGAIWEVMLYKYSWRKVGEVADNFVHSGKYQKVARVESGGKFKSCSILS